MLSDRLKELGIELSEDIGPLGVYLPCKQISNLLYLSAIFPLKSGEIMARGAVDKDLSIEEAGQCARQVVINALSIAKNHLGSLDRIKGCVKLSGYVASAEGFFEHPKVMNYASSLLLEIFGERGRHTRSVIGVFSLPLNSPVAIEFIFELY